MVQISAETPPDRPRVSKHCVFHPASGQPPRGTAVAGRPRSGCWALGGQGGLAGTCRFFPPRPQPAYAAAGTPSGTLGEGALPHCLGAEPSPGWPSPARRCVRKETLNARACTAQTDEADLYFC